MGKIKRGGFIFITWIGDHEPNHVHVYRDGKEVLKYNLDENVVMKGKLVKKIEKIIIQLKEERLI